MNSSSYAPISHYLDYTQLKPGATLSEVQELCEEGIRHEVAAICVSPMYVAAVAHMLADTSTACCTVVGFPHGLHLTETKMAEAQALIQAGAQELDMVNNLSLLREGNWAELEQEISLFANICRSEGGISKLIIESGLLTFEEIGAICDICITANVDFVKTSTGFAAVGAEVEKVTWMRDYLPDHVRIKASGGIRTYEDAKAFVAAGASRIGASTLIVEPKNT
ncbi:MAG: deoxyribose-phosphate aldolase [Bacteroidota bacterium]